MFGIRIDKDKKVLKTIKRKYKNRAPNITKY